MSDSVTRAKSYVPKRQHIVTDERREHRQSPASPEGGSPEASPGGGWKRSDERANRHLPGGGAFFIGMSDEYTVVGTGRIPQNDPPHS